MWRVVGIVVLSATAVAAAALLAAGHLVSAQLVSSASGSTPMGGWEVTEYSIALNWWLAVPLAGCLIVGLVCVMAPRRRSPGA